MNRLFPAALGVFAAALAGCASGDVAPHTTVAAPLTLEETGLWRRADEVRAAIQRSGFVVEDANLQNYLSSVVERLAAADGLDPTSFSLHALRDPSLNAFALPNGALYIHSGLLARMQNEAHLAAVISHEMTHVTHRHALQQFRDLKSKTGFLALASASAGSYGGVVELLGGLGVLAAVSGYSRDMETEADIVGWHRMARAGYDTNEAPAVFRMLMADVAQDKRPEPYLFSSHPRLAERERNFRELLATHPPTEPGDLGKERFQTAVLPLLVLNGEAELRAGKFIAARDQLWRYRLGRPDDVRACWLLGEVERQAGAAGSRDDARKLFEQALLMDPQFPPAHRSLGLLEFQQGPSAAAADHLRHYLDLEPTASDRGYIESYIRQCDTATASSSSS